MQVDLFRSPQLFVIGRITKIQGFETQQTAFLRCNFIVGDQWKLLSGTSSCQSFQSKICKNQAIIQHPIDLHYCCQSVRGWPKIFLQVWVKQQDGRSQLYGYGTSAVPFTIGSIKLDIPCWRPKGSWTDVGANPELKWWGLVLSSSSRFGFEATSSCKVKIQLDLITKDFGAQGVKLS